ncbi:hypothetical protein PS903_04339 [Pseudomonas fluorescens]|nr:hypothetical protein PS903_04339 [Pseudomonas fluorescens]
MLGRGDGADYPLGADLYPFCAKVNEDTVGAGLLANRQDRCIRCTATNPCRSRLAGEGVPETNAKIQGPLRCGAAIRQASSYR